MHILLTFSTELLAEYYRRRKRKESGREAGRKGQREGAKGRGAEGREGDRLQARSGAALRPLSFLKAFPSFFPDPELWPAVSTHSAQLLRGYGDGKRAGNTFLIFHMGALVTTKILSKGSNFKEEKLA